MVGGDQHRAFLRRRDCDVWLLTEVRTDVRLHGYQRTVTDAFMAEDRHWSAILSRSGLQESDDPHPTTVAAVVGDTTYWSSVLPWRTCGSQEPWHGSTHADKIATALATLERARPGGPLVWGGDWNQAFIGANYAGSADGRRHLLASIDRLDPYVPTAGLPHQLPGHASNRPYRHPRGRSRHSRRTLARGLQRNPLVRP